MLLSTIIIGIVTTALLWSPFGSLLDTPSPVPESKDTVSAPTPESDEDKPQEDETKKPAETPPPAPAPQPKSTAPKPKPEATVGSVLNLLNWKLTLPIDTPHPGTPDEISQPELATFTSDPYFRLNHAKNGVVFRAHAGGATTANSDYPRSELREMTASGQQRANWSNTGGSHTMTIRQTITHVPAVKPHVVAGQIHDADDDVVMIRLEGPHLFVESDGKEVGTLDPSYTLGTVFTVKITADDGHIRVSYNGEQKVDLARQGSGYYFKAGCYTQSNPSKGEDPQAYGEVIIYDLRVSHS